MRGMTRLSGLDKYLGSASGSTPGWLMPPGAESGSITGKAKEEEDTTYRLFIMPLLSHT